MHHAAVGGDSMAVGAGDATVRSMVSRRGESSKVVSVFILRICRSIPTRHSNSLDPFLLIYNLLYRKGPGPGFRFTCLKTYARYSLKLSFSRNLFWSVHQCGILSGSDCLSLALLPFTYWRCGLLLPMQLLVHTSTAYYMRFYGDGRISSKVV